MSSSYPSATKSYTTKLDGPSHVVNAADVNGVQDEVVAIENGLLTGLQHDLKFTDATFDIGKTGATRPRDLFTSRDVTVGRNETVTGTLGVTGVTTLTAQAVLNGGATFAGSLLATDATYDIGAAGATRFRDCYLSRDLVVGDQLFEHGRTTAVGEWIAVTHSAGNFTASSGNWTVASGDQSVFAYTLIGKTMTVAFIINTTTVSATPTSLQIAIPGSFTAARAMSQAMQYNDNNGGWLTGSMEVSAAAQTVMKLYTAGFGSVAWSASTDLTSVRGNFTFEVQ